MDPRGSRRAAIRVCRAGGGRTDAARHLEPRLPVPTGALEHQKDNAVRTCARLPREERPRRLDWLFRDRLRALAGGRRHEGGHAEPPEPVMADRLRAVAAGCPDPAPDRLQPDPVLAGGEDNGLDARGRGFRLVHCFTEVFLNSARASSLAERAWRVRGRCRLQPIAFSAAQPRCGAKWESPCWAARKPRPSAPTTRRHLRAEW